LIVYHFRPFNIPIVNTVGITAVGNALAFVAAAGYRAPVFAPLKNITTTTI